MLKLDFHNNRGPMTVLTLITALNVGLVINFLTANIGGAGFVLNGIRLYVLVGLEFVVVIAAYVASKRRNTTVPF
jgi:uncharacterized membrane protein YuzA (DUF378 family)